MDEKVEQFTKWAHDVIDEARPRLLAGLAAATAADPDTSPERVERLEETARIAAKMYSNKDAHDTR